MIGIIGAMQEEITPILEKMEATETKELQFRTCYTGLLHGKEVVVVLAGIGKVNAAITTTLLASNFELTHIVNIGVAGGQKGVKHNDLVVGKFLVYHDVDVTEFGLPHGTVPGMPHTFFSDQSLVQKSIDILQKLDITYQIGGIASGDQFVYSSSVLEKINEKYQNVFAIEMEACAIAHTAHLFNIPFIVYRSISDVIDDPSQDKDFSTFLTSAANRSAMVLEALIRAL